MDSSNRCFVYETPYTRLTMDKTCFTARLREFLDNEARSYTMDYGCITPLYVYRCWGGIVALEVIEAGLRQIKNDY